MSLSIRLLCSTVSDFTKFLLALVYIGFLDIVSGIFSKGPQFLPTLSFASLNAFCSKRTATWMTLPMSLPGWESKRRESILMNAYISKRLFTRGGNCRDIHLLNPMPPFLNPDLSPPAHSRWLLLERLYHEMHDSSVLSVCIVLLYSARSTTGECPHVLHFPLVHFDSTIQVLLYLKMPKVARRPGWPI